MQRGGDSNASKAGQTGEATAGRAEGVSQSGARGDPNERRTGEESGERGEFIRRPGGRARRGASRRVGVEVKVRAFRSRARSRARRGEGLFSRIHTTHTLSLILSNGPRF